MSLFVRFSIACMPTTESRRFTEFNMDIKDFTLMTGDNSLQKTSNPFTIWEELCSDHLVEVSISKKFSKPSLREASTK